MAVTVAIVAQGAMGAAVGGVLVDRGARVITSLAGRGAESRARAERMGIVHVEDDDALVAQADFFLSILPPDRAMDLAERFSGPIARAARKPVYVECNATSPDTARQIGAFLASTGCRYVDAGITGSPPKPGSTGTVFHASGPDAPEFGRLRDYGLDIRVSDKPIGAASAIKMCYASLTKGTQALYSFIVLAAKRAGVEEELCRQLVENHPSMLGNITKMLPMMFSKAYRWDGEMLEIAEFLRDDAAAAEVYQAFSRLYGRLGVDYAAGAQGEIASLDGFCRKGAAAMAAPPVRAAG